MSDSNSRRSIAVDRAVTIHTARGATLRTSLASLSARGAGILYPCATRAGRKMLLRFTLPIQGRYREIRAHAEVVSTRLSGDRFIANVHFVGMSPEHRWAVDKFLRETVALRSQG